VFAGSFRGKVLFENPEYINPNAVRAYEKRKQAGAYDQKVHQKKRRKDHVEIHAVGEEELADRNVFARPPAAGGTDGVGHIGRIEHGGGVDLRHGCDEPSDESMGDGAE
jgi:hypothetical protein